MPPFPLQPLTDLRFREAESNQLDNPPSETVEADGLIGLAECEAAKMTALAQVAAKIAGPSARALEAVRSRLELSGPLDSSTSIKAADLDRMLGDTQALMERVLSFAQPAPSTRHPIAVKPLVDELLEDLRVIYQAPLKVIARHQHRDDWFMANPERAREVLWNLLINSVEAMPTGGTLQVLTGRTDSSRMLTVADSLSGPGYLWIEVRDTGTGIPKDLLPRVFEPFVGTKQHDGAGLGLSIIYYTLRDLGGGAVLESNPGKGTSVKIFLPRAEIMV